MRRALGTVVMIWACVAHSGATVRLPARGAPAAQDTTAPFAGTLGPVQHPSAAALARPAVLRAVRAGRDAGFDRLVFEFSGDASPGYQVEYVTQPVRACGSGALIPLSGTGHLMVRFEPAQAHDTLGRDTTSERALAPHLPQVQELKLVCDFEGQVEWAIGLAARRRFRVLVDSQPSRVIVDVRHRD